MSKFRWGDNRYLTFGELLQYKAYGGFQIAITGNNKSPIIRIFISLVQQIKCDIYVCLLFFVSLPFVSTLWASTIFLLKLPHHNGYSACGKGLNILFMSQLLVGKPRCVG